MNAAKLKAKMSEMIISSAPTAFSSEYLGDELGSFSSCRSRYATMINTTPMNPARSNKWKLMVIATAIARRHESRIPAAHYNHCPDWLNTAPSRTGSDANPLHIGRLFPKNPRTRQFICSFWRSTLNGEGQYHTRHQPRMMAFSLSGCTRVTASSGESHTFVAGDCLLLDDTSGKGHSTEVISDLPARWVFIRLPN